MLLTQLQQDTKGNIKDIFLLRLSPTLSVVLTQLLNTLGFLIENAQDTFKAPRLVALNMYLTLHLLLF